MSRAATDLSSIQLFRSLFEPEQQPVFAEAANRLRQSALDMHSRAAEIANEIGRDLPELTQHDVTHLDAVAALASTLAGENIALNPAECHVLLAAILVHDLAMSDVATQIIDRDVQHHETWPDKLALQLRSMNGRAPTPAELAAPTADAIAATKKAMLRDLHAENAEQMPTAHWSRAGGDAVFLIVDPEIRTALARTIGRVAASHHWNHDQLIERLSNPLGSPSFLPSEWKIDQILLACILRAADAAHIDSSRSPDLLAATRSLSEDSIVHWEFQRKLMRPYVDRDRLVFTSSDSFTTGEIPAWWLAYDTIQLINTELRAIDGLLADTDRPRLQVKRVAASDSPLQLSQLLPCEGWEPIDSTLKVGDVSNLVRRLGGKELYGNDKTIAIRELIINACDAVKARSAINRYRGNGRAAGSVEVAIRTTNDGTACISITDDGIGMSRDVMSGPLLDFGRSSWLSAEVVRGNRGLIASEFEPTGRFGIGFFSVFMLGPKIRVYSRAMGAAAEDTWVLEFGSGASERPTIRRAMSQEAADEPGTQVVVELDPELLTADGSIRIDREIDNGHIVHTQTKATLDELVRFLVPASDVDIWTVGADGSERTRSVGADDWIQIPAYDLLARIVGPSQIIDKKVNSCLRALATTVEVVTDEDDRPVARIGFLPEEAVDLIGWSGNHYSNVTAGRARTSTRIHGAAGLFLGTAERAARDAAVPRVSNSVIGRWATNNLRHLPIESATGHFAQETFNAVWAFGGETSGIPAWQTADGWLTSAEIAEWLLQRERFWLVHPVHLIVRVGMTRRSLSPVSNCLYFESGWRPPLRTSEGYWPPIRGLDTYLHGGMHSELARICAAAWGIEVRAFETADRAPEKTQMLVALDGEEPVMGDATEYDRTALVQMSELLHLSERANDGDDNDR